MKYRIFLLLPLLCYFLGCGKQAIKAIPLGHGNKKTVPSNSLPKGYRMIGKYAGDLNGDGVNDSVLLVKAIDPLHIVTNKSGELVDRNRRGLLVFLSGDGTWKNVVRNLDCFASEYEDGGVYYPPQLNIAINSNQLQIAYEHGRYGHWDYSFEYNGTDFDLVHEIHYASNPGTTHDTQIIQIDYKTKLKTRQEIDWELTDEDANDPVYRKTMEAINHTEFTKLSEIVDFEALE